ncbi:MAG: sulfatase [Planctomycetota bacterium]
MNRTSHIAAALTAALGTLAPTAAAEPMNILFIAVDDLRPALACYGDEHAITPNIDRLAARGTIFANAHTQQAVCAPSRISLLTGLRPDTTQVWDLKTRLRDHLPDAITLPQHLRSLGYATVGMGKIFDIRSTDQQLDEPSWSIPFQDVSSPSDDTFHYRDPEHVELVLTKKQAAREAGVRGWRAVRDFIGTRPSTDQADVPDNAYPDGAIADKGIEWIETLAPEEEPFFIAVGFKKPHLPFNAPSRYWDMYDRDQFERPVSTSLPDGAPEIAFQDSWELRGGYTDVPERGVPVPEEDRKRLTHGYYACVSYIDTQVGRLLDALDASGEADQTVIVLWGDHGFHLGDHGMFCKHTNFEMATRVPLIFTAPQVAANTAPHRGPVEFVDVFPTLCDLAGIPAPEGLHGLSLRPAMIDIERDVKPIAVSQYPRNHTSANALMGYSVRDRRFRYTEWRRSDGLGPGTGRVVHRELYDYETDPHETRNVADDPTYAAERARLAKHLREADVIGPDPHHTPTESMSR